VCSSDLWYGEELPFIVRGKAKNGTDRFIRFATIGVVEDGKRFTLRVLPVTPLSCKEKIVRELLAFVQRFVSVRVVLLDRGFYSNEVVQTLKDLGHGFVMPAKKYDKVKQLMATVVKDGPRVYEMSKGTTFTLVVVKDRKTRRLFAYATNLDDLQPSMVHELYTRRFGIETQYRVKNQFLGKTCSKQYGVRYAFFVLAVALYNLWVLLNIVKRGNQGLDPGIIPLKVEQLKHIFRKVIYQQAPY
jgi:IS4 transposase